MLPKRVNVGGYVAKAIMKHPRPVYLPIYLPLIKRNLHKLNTLFQTSK